jgi:hypothetical protein
MSIGVSENRGANLRVPAGVDQLESGVDNRLIIEKLTAPRNPFSTEKKARKTATDMIQLPPWKHSR